MHTVLKLLFVLASGLAPVAAGSEPPRFREQPTVRKAGGKVEIRFAAAAATDVEVAILDRDGRVVRHLAAGALGRKPPPPLKPGLSQSLLWDGKDDAGKPVNPGDCKVRVRLGLRPTFEKVLGWKGEAIGEAISGLAVDERGRVYVLNSGGKKPTRIYILDRRGKYVKSILPYPADLPQEKVKALGHLELTDGKRVPIIRQPITFTCYPEMYGGGPGDFGMPQQTMALVDDQLVMTNPWQSSLGVQVTHRRLLILNTDGSIPENYLGPLLAGSRLPGCVRLARVPGEKAVFATGFVDSGDWKKAKPLNVVYKVRMDRKGAPEVFLGEPNKAGRDKKHFNDPRGLAVDRHGNVYVSDWGNNRIVVFRSDGRYLGEIVVDKPGQLAVHQKSGAIYVLSVKQRRFPIMATALRKLSPVVGAGGKWVGGGKELGATTLRYGDCTLAVDGTAEPTVVWLGHRFGTPSLFRMEEKDGKFSKRVPTVAKGDPSLLVGGFLAVDPRREEVYTQVHGAPASWESWPGAYKSVSRWARIDGRTGEISRVGIVGTEVAVGPAGRLYVHGRSQLGRFDREGKPVPFPATGTHVLVRTARRKNGNIEPDSPFALLHGPSGHCVGADGKVYVMYPHISGAYKADSSTVDVYGSDGKIERKAVVRCGPDAEGVQVDARGNIYVADNVKTPSAVYPPELAGRIPRSRKWKHGLNWYAWYGGVLKFSPAGGEARAATGAAHTSCWGDARFAVKVHGAEWVHTGIYPMPGGAVWLGCSCFGSRFGVDGFGRVFMPDVATFSVRVIDARANPIIRFGGYGNMDSGGPGSAVPTPAIAFAWPQYVAVSDKAVYVSDVINRRIVRVRLAYDAEARCAIP